MLNLTTGAVELKTGNLTNNPNYKFILRREAVGSSPPVIVEGNLPESFAFGVSAEYEQRLPSDLSNVVILRKLSAFTNYNKIVQELSHQVWGGSSPFDFSLSVLFDAVEDARTDVMLPIQRLMTLALPYKENPNGLLLNPPGPNLLNPDEGRVSLQIGKMAYFHSVLITDVSPTFDTRMTPNGLPVSATCDLSLMTINTPVASDINNFFQVVTDSQGRATPTEAQSQYGTASRLGSAEDILEILKADGADIRDQATEDFETVVGGGIDIIDDGIGIALENSGISTTIGNTASPDLIGNVL